MPLDNNYELPLEDTYEGNLAVFTTGRKSEPAITQETKADVKDSLHILNLGQNEIVEVLPKTEKDECSLRSDLLTNRSGETSN